MNINQKGIFRGVKKNRINMEADMFPGGGRRIRRHDRNLKDISDPPYGGQKNSRKLEKGVQHEDFPGGHPS